VARINELLRQGAELEWRNPTYGMTPLASACYNGSYEAAEALCAHGADLDTRDDVQNTPLMFAACFGHPKICAMLLALGADPSLNDCEGKTALDKARKNNKPECAALLQQHQQELLLQQQVQAEVDAVATPAPAAAADTKMTTTDTRGTIMPKGLSAMQRLKWKRSQRHELASPAPGAELLEEPASPPATSTATWPPPPPPLPAAAAAMDGEKQAKEAAPAAAASEVPLGPDGQPLTGMKLKMWQKKRAKEAQEAWAAAPPPSPPSPMQSPLTMATVHHSSPWKRSGRAMRAAGGLSGAGGRRDPDQVRKRRLCAPYLC